MKITKDDVIKFIKNMPLIELTELIKELEEEIEPFLKLRNQKLLTSIEDKSLLVKGDRLRLLGRIDVGTPTG